MRSRSTLTPRAASRRPTVAAVVMAAAALGVPLAVGVAPASAEKDAGRAELTPLRSGSVDARADAELGDAPRAPNRPRLPRAADPAGSNVDRAEASIDNALERAPRAPKGITRRVLRRELGAAATAQSLAWLSGVNEWTFGCRFGVNGPETDLMLSAYAMHSTLNDGTLPKIGDRYWGKLYYGVTALPCSGLQDVRSEVVLPGNTGLSYDVPSGAHIRCFVKSPSRNDFVEVTDQTETVPLPSGASVTFKWCSKTHSVGARGPFIAQPLLGRGWEYQVVFPLASYREMKGMATNDRMVGAPSGTGLAFSAPQVWTNVLDRPVSIGYPSPSVTAITSTTAHTRAFAFNWWKEGKVWAEAVRADGSGLIKSPETALATDDAHGYAVENDWSGLAPDTDYRWRLIFRGSNGQITTGDWQPFKTSGSKPRATTRPTVSGAARVGAALTRTTGAWSGEPRPTLSTQWMRCTSTGTACAPIGGATAGRYVPRAADAGKRLKVRVTARNAHGRASADSAPSRPVAR